MKILFAIKNMNNAKGGAERVLSFVVNGLIDKGYDVSLLTFDERGLDTFYKIDARVKRISLGIGHSEQRAGLKETAGRIRAIRRVVQVRRPDIVVPFMHSMFIPMAFALIGIRIPIIASEHIVPLHYKKRKHEFLLLMFASLLVTKITVLSKAVKALYPGFIRNKMVVVPNPVHIDNEDDFEKGADPLRKIILNVGRLSDQKDQKTLIRAFSLIADKYEQWDIRIAGEGENRVFLKELIDKLGLTARVHLIGTTSDIAKEYRIAQIFAMPSRYESFGLATAEAMSFGVPAIGFKECAGTNEIIKHNKNGLLVKRKGDHIKNYSHGLESLMSNYALRKKLGVEAKENIGKYHPKIIVNRWEKLIMNVLSV